MDEITYAWEIMPVKEFLYTISNGQYKVYDYERERPY